MGTAPFPLLRILADGRFHSGERLGRALGLSRAGVWNLVRRIAAWGLRVFKVRGGGYRLAEAQRFDPPDEGPHAGAGKTQRSAGHTPELQSLTQLAWPLMLDK